jgi:uncharacterized damage-inducible protein DinB
LESTCTGRKKGDGILPWVSFMGFSHARNWEKNAEAQEIFAALTPEDLERKCVTPGGTEMAVWKWLRAMVEHEVHHRGQIYMILSLLGIPTPPLYGLTSEEVRARSAG